MIGVARMNWVISKLGTGTIIRADGLILTAWHVVRRASSCCQCPRPDRHGNELGHMVEIQYECVVEARDVGCDAALFHSEGAKKIVRQRTALSFRMLASAVHAEASGLRPLALADSDTVGLGDLASVPAFRALVAGLTLTDGTICRSRRFHRRGSSLRAPQGGRSAEGCRRRVGIMNMATQPILTPGACT